MCLNVSATKSIVSGNSVNPDSNGTKERKWMRKKKAEADVYECMRVEGFCGIPIEYFFHLIEDKERNQLGSKRKE